MFKNKYTFCNQCKYGIEGTDFCGCINNCIEGSEFVVKEFCDDVSNYIVNNFGNDYCKNCSCNPKNGGTGICNCTLGGYHVTC